MVGGAARVRGRTSPLCEGVADGVRLELFRRAPSESACPTNGEADDSKPEGNTIESVVVLEDIVTVLL